jgi:hypothetical protein
MESSLHPHRIFVMAIFHHNHCGYFGIRFGPINDPECSRIEHDVIRHEDVSQCVCVPTNPTQHIMTCYCQMTHSSFIRLSHIIHRTSRLSLWFVRYGTRIVTVFFDIFYYSLVTTSPSMLVQQSRKISIGTGSDHQIGHLFVSNFGFQAFRHA